MVEMITFEPELEVLYVRALIAVARADRTIDHQEGERIDQIVKKRFPTVSVAELMFEPALRTDELVKGLGAEVEGGPFRNAKIDPQELGRMFVQDALGVLAAQDGVSSTEEAALLRFAPIFGMPTHEVRKALANVK